MRARIITAVLSTLAALSPLTLVALGPTPHAAADTGTVTQPTQNFTSAGTYDVTVPAEVDYATLDALGGAGYAGDPSSSGWSHGGAGGSGTRVDISVGTQLIKGGDRLQVVVGAKGGGGQRGYGSQLSGSGGNGGGATVVTDVTTGITLLVAGGGGGGGGGSGVYIRYDGGRGGTNSDGTPGLGAFYGDAGRGGAAGRISVCSDPILAQGGTGESAPTGSGAAGGGGGGQGACGGGGQSGGSGEHGAGEGGGGGGGAGASYAVTDGSDQQYAGGTNTGDGSASITFTTYLPQAPGDLSPNCVYAGDLSVLTILGGITSVGHPAPTLSLLNPPGWLQDDADPRTPDGLSNLEVRATGPVAPGQYRTLVEASNGVGSVIDPLTIVVGPEWPAFVSPDTASATAGTPFTFQVDAVGCPVFTDYAITAGQNGVPWLGIDPETGALSGTPTASDVGTHTISVQAGTVGTAGTSITQTLTLHVDPAPATTPGVPVPPNSAPPARTAPPGSPSPAGPAPGTGGSAPGMGAAAPGSTGSPAKKPSADLALSVTGDPSVRSGRTFTETVTLVNHGPSAAKHVRIQLTVPSGLVVTQDVGGVRHRGSVVWKVRSLAAHVKVTDAVTFHVRAHGPTTRTIRVNAHSHSVPDPHHGNNHAKVRLRITARVS